MYKTRKSSIGKQNKITITTDALADYLDCGRATAMKIGNAAGARIKIGRRVLWNIDRIQNYLDGLSEQEV